MTADARMLSEATWKQLTPAAKDVLGQLYLHGPCYDGGLVSKMGRDVLVNLGLVERGFGWQWLTLEGVKTATFAPVSPSYYDGKWLRKQVM